MPWHDRVEPLCCGNEMVESGSFDVAVYECLLRDHHPRVLTPALLELLEAAFDAGRAGEGTFKAFAEEHLNVEFPESAGKSVAQAQAELNIDTARSRLMRATDDGYPLEIENAHQRLARAESDLAHYSI
ncbi:hypothetical protein [Nocardia aurea]|uniref:hypothetical protein n=1 Tax=Nocardia aurea TaxID=2144174 RepID=UPI0033A4C5DB